jgi:hypothetical protein
LRKNRGKKTNRNESNFVNSKALSEASRPFVDENFRRLLNSISKGFKCFSIMKRLLNYVLIAILIASASATINPSNNKKNKQKTTGDDVKEKSGPQDKSVYERNLVDNEPLASDIIAEAGTHFKETGLKNFNGTVLGYVTPVSSHRFFLSSL